MFGLIRRTLANDPPVPLSKYPKRINTITPINLVSRLIPNGGTIPRNGGTDLTCFSPSDRPRMGSVVDCADIERQESDCRLVGEAHAAGFEKMLVVDGFSSHGPREAFPLKQLFWSEKLEKERKSFWAWGRDSWIYCRAAVASRDFLEDFPQKNTTSAAKKIERIPRTTAMISSALMFPCIPASC